MLTKDLQALTTGDNIDSPTDGSEVLSAAYVVFDAPLGRAHHGTGKFIDFMVFIDTPFDVAMARRLLRGIANAPANEAAENIEVELTSYLNGARTLYVDFQDRIKQECDLVLDGRLSINELAEEIRVKMPQR